MSLEPETALVEVSGRKGSKKPTERLQIANETVPSAAKMNLHPVTTGRVIITLAALSEMIGPYLADWNESHVFNPN